MRSHAVRHTAARYQRSAFLYALAGGIGAAAKRLAIWLVSKCCAAAVRQQLGVMTRRELRDIGLTPFDIEAVARGDSPLAPH